MKIYNNKEHTRLDYYFYNEASYSNILGSALYSFQFKTIDCLKLNVDYQESFYKMVLCSQGYSRTYKKEQHAYSFNSGKALLYKTTTEPYISELKGETEYDLIHLHFSWQLMEELKQLSANIFKQDVTEIPMDISQMQLFKNRKKLSDINPVLSDLFLEKIMMEQLYAFAETSLKKDHRQFIKLNSDREKIYEARHILDSSIAYVSIEVLSKQVGINTFKLKKLFKEEFNKPVFEYQVDSHFSKAHSMLLDTMDSIENIAQSCGYQSTGSFSNAFKRKFGVRPSDIRKY